MASNESRIEGFGDKLVNNTRDIDVAPITTNKAKEDNEANSIVVIEKDEEKLEKSNNSNEFKYHLYFFSAYYDKLINPTYISLFLLNKLK